jgi:hypothetical protein
MKKAIPFEVNDARLLEAFLDHLLLNAVVDLKETSQPSWGKMTAQHMVEHLLWVVEFSTGRREAKCSLPENVVARMKRFLYNNSPTPRDFKNPLLSDNPPLLRFKSLAEAITMLEEELGRFQDLVRVQPEAAYIHPLFGLIATEEWERVLFKHSYHHLLQFGLVKLTPTKATHRAGEREAI